MRSRLARHKSHVFATLSSEVERAVAKVVFHFGFAYAVCSTNIFSVFFRTARVTNTRHNVGSSQCGRTRKTKLNTVYANLAVIET